METGLAHALILNPISSIACRASFGAGSTASSWGGGRCSGAGI